MALLIEGCAVRASIAGNDASNRPHDVIGRKHLSRFIRSRSPLVAQLALLRHAGRPGALSELFYELGSVPRDRRRLSEARNGRDVCWLEAPVESEPLVTVRIATKDRPGLLVERALASALNQTYERIEILIVGDHCDERTQDALSLVSDPRIRYINLGRQGDYPTEPTRRWQVAGSKPMNAGLLLASGDWIAPCDDDDELDPTHVEQMLRFAQAQRLEFVWSKTIEVRPGDADRQVGHPVMSPSACNHGAVLYSMGLAAMPYSPTSDRLDEPFDWNLWKRLQLAGVKMAYLDEVTYRTWPAGAAQYETGNAR